MSGEAKTLTGEAIRSQPEPDCALCGQKGETLYTGQKDRLFLGAGLWNLKKCPNRDCGLVWLDPMPLKEDIWKAYLSYYTHAPEAGQSSVQGRFGQRFELGYIRSRFGYPSSEAGIWARLIGFLIYHREGGSTFVEWKPGGRLLDVGCGAGGYLKFMRSLGWEVEGVEFDPAAVEAARQSGLNVRAGVLEEQAYPPASFDVITLQHVIEHVPDPVATMVECARLLRPGGKALFFTPNSASLTHRIFKQDWRGLEPPRHLHIFSPASARRALGLAGFKDIAIRPQAAASIITDSIQIRRGCNPYGPGAGERRFLRVLARAAAFWEGVLAKGDPSLADCIAAVAIKG
jgi:2-polyprenyl-3-methyl-5-hydroxy-6-metoxy-1,4-benzoquinol methylase